MLRISKFETIIELTTNKVQTLISNWLHDYSYIIETQSMLINILHWIKAGTGKYQMYMLLIYHHLLEFEEFTLQFNQLSVYRNSDLAKASQLAGYLFDFVFRLSQLIYVILTARKILTT